AVASPVTASAQSLIAGELRGLDGHGARVGVEAAAEAVPAHGAGGPDRPVVVDLAMADGEGGKEGLADVGHAPADRIARVTPTAAGTTDGSVPTQRAIVQAEGRRAEETEVDDGAALALAAVAAFTAHPADRFVVCERSVRHR